MHFRDHRDKFSPIHRHLPPFMGSPFGHGFRDWRHFMPYTLKASATEYLITMPLPGFDRENVDVSVKGHHILIEARKERKKPEEGKKGYRKIRSVGGFLWKKRYIHVLVPVPEKIEAESVKAKLSKGVLTVTFKRTPGTKINVDVEE